MASIDYNKLLLAINSCITSESLRHRFIHPSRVLRPVQRRLIVGGYGDIEQAFLAGYAHPPAIAVKMLRPHGGWYQRVRIVAALCRELRVLADLNHPNILALQGFCLDAQFSRAEIITFWQDNSNVLAYIAIHQPNQTRRLQLALDTARGLEYLHSRRPPVCHADIKPENTLVDRHGNAMLCDFGLARILDDEPSGLTTSGSLQCTIRYASLELFAKDGARHTLKSDIWAWGCLLLDIIAGIRPYASCRGQSVVVAISKSRSPADLTQIEAPYFVLEILERCWRQSAERRPTALWCSEVLSWQTTDLFRAYCINTIQDVPSQYKIVADGRHVVHNPDVEMRFSFDFLTRFDSVEVGQLSHPHFSPDGSAVAVDDGQAIRLYDVATATLLSLVPISERSQDRDEFPKIAFSASWSSIATGHPSGVIRIWSMADQTLSAELRGHANRICSLAWSNADSILVSASTDDTLCVWDAKSGTALRVIPVAQFCCLIGSPHHSMIVASAGQQTWIYDAESGQLMPFDSRSADAATFAPNGKSLVTCNDGQEGLEVWDLRPWLDAENNKETPSPDAMQLTYGSIEGPSAMVDSLSISSDGRLAICGSYAQGGLIMWDLKEGRPTSKMGGQRLREVDDVAFRPGSTASEGILAFTFYHEQLRVRKLQLGQSGWWPRASAKRVDGVVSDS